MIPPFSSPVIERRRLREHFGPNGCNLGPVTLVHAPMGYGKTTFLCRWAIEARGNGTPLHWVTAPPSPDPASFWHRMSMSVGLDPAVSPIEATLRWVDGLSRPTIVIIDSYQRATGGEADAAIVDLASRNDNLRLVIASRRLAAMTNPLLGLATRITLVGKADLAFDIGESHELAHELHQRCAYMTRIAHDQLDGWPLALRTVLAEAARETLLDESLAHLTEGLFALTEDPLRQRLVTAIATCDGISISLLTEELGIDHADAVRALRDLEDLGVLAGQREHPTTTASCLPGLRKYLADRAQEVWQAEALRVLRTDSARELESIRPVEALLRFLELGHYDAADEIVFNHFDQSMPADDRLQQALRGIPVTILEDHNALLMLRLFVERDAPSTPIEAVESLANRARRSVSMVLANTSEPRMIAMAASRVLTDRILGNWGPALDLSRILVDRLGSPTYRAMHAWWTLLPHLYAELSLTGVLGGDSALAQSAAAAGARAADAQGNPSARVRALSLSAIDCALTERYDDAIAMLRDADSSAKGAPAETLAASETDRELAQLLVSHHTGDEATAELALQRLRPTIDRLEQWPLMIRAESDHIRATKGTYESFIRLRQHLQNRPVGISVPTAVERSLLLKLADLAMFNGHYREAADALDAVALPGLTSARLSLFLGNYQDAYRTSCEQLRSGAAGDAHQLEQALVLHALAARNLDKLAESYASLERLRSWLRQSGTVSSLATVPFAMIMSLAVECAQAGGTDLVPTLESIPVMQRIVHYGALTAAELRTLRAFATSESVPETAQTLFVSTNTVKFHLRSVYRKLHATNRLEALERAIWMELLD